MNNITIDEIEFPLFIRSDEQEEDFVRDGTISSDEVRYYAELYDNFKNEIYQQTNYRRHTLATSTVTDSQSAYVNSVY